MKTLKTAILIVLMLAIGVCGYMVYQEYFGDQEPQEQPAQCEPQVTKLNDSTYHLNMSDCSCVTFEAVNDTLNVGSVGVNFIHQRGDTIRIGTLQTYVLRISDFYDSTQFSNININFPGN